MKGLEIAWKNNIPPAKIKQQWKDCVILEEYLSVCRTLKTRGSNGKRVFCTSNRSDYALDGEPHDLLAQEFEEVGLTYSEDLSWAISRMGLSKSGKS